MKIGFFASFNETAGGIFQYACSMFNVLRLRDQDNFTAFVLPDSPLKQYMPESWRIIEIPPQIFTTNADRAGKMTADGIELQVKGCNSRAADFFHSFGIDLLLFASPEMISFESGLPYLMPFHDLQHRIQPHFPEVSALGTWQWREYLFRNGAKFADGILVDSKIGKEDVLNYYGSLISAGKLHILPLPPAYTPDKTEISRLHIAGMRLKYHLPEQYFFYPAQFWMHKNHARLIQALHILRFRYKTNIPIALVGSRIGGAAEAREKIYEMAMHLAEQLDVQDLCRYLGYVPDQDMPLLYAGAAALVMPTMFGPTNTPVSEAWGLGCPVITSDIRGIREHTGDAGLLVDPTSADSIAEAMLKISSDTPLRNELVERGKIKYREYNQAHFASALFNAIDNTAKLLGIYTAGAIRSADQTQTAKNNSSSEIIIHRSKSLPTNKVPLVSAIVSVYKAEKYMHGLFENLLSQTLYKKGLLEIIVINSNSPENEDDIIQKYVRQHSNIQYIKTPERETIYEAWNRGIKMSKSAFITNANTDDRHRPDALEVMAKALDSYPQIGLVYADSFVTTKENDTFCITASELRYDLPDFNLGTQLSSSCFGAQPMWRRALHDSLGYFDTELKIAGDYDFFIRVAWKAGAAHIRETLGLFLARPDSASGSNNTKITIDETLLILRKYRTEIPLLDLYPLLRNINKEGYAHAAALWDYGNLCALSPYRDYEIALQYYERALQVKGLTETEKEILTIGLINNGGVISYCLGNVEQAKNLLEGASDKSPEANYNLQLLNQALKQNTRLYALHFRMVQFNHHVIKSARMSKGLRLTSEGNLAWTNEHEQVFWDGYIGLDGVEVSPDERKQAQSMQPRLMQKANTNQQKTHSNELIYNKRSFEKKRIAMTMYGWDEEGGGTQLPRTIAENLAKQGHAVAVFYAGAHNIPGKEAYYCHHRIKNGIELIGIYNRPTLFFDLLNPEREIEDALIRKYFADFLDNFQPNIIHFHNLFNLSISIAQEAKFRNIPSAFTSHNFWLICPRLYLLTEDGKQCTGPDKTGRKCALCLGNIDQAQKYNKRLQQGIHAASEYFSLHLAPSSRTKELFTSSGHSEKNIRVVRQASPIIDKIIKHRTIKNRDNLLRVGYLGAAIPIKGVHILALAAQQFSCRELIVSVHGNISTEYEAYLREIDKKNILRFSGAYTYEYLPEILSQLDLVVVPSLVEETGGLTTVESLAAGIPVIASRIGGLTDAVTDGKNGLLFTPGNVGELSNALKQMIENKDLYYKLQQNARHEKTFNEFLNELLSIYDELILANAKYQ